MSENVHDNIKKNERIMTADTAQKLEDINKELQVQMKNQQKLENLKARYKINKQNSKSSLARE